jgi:hypothetical protein
MYTFIVSVNIHIWLYRTKRGYLIEKGDFLLKRKVLGMWENKIELQQYCQGKITFSAQNRRRFEIISWIEAVLRKSPATNS